MNITETVKSFLDKYHLENQTVIVGFSGGYDSLCLLDTIKNIGNPLIAVHLNHNWRGEESLRDEEFCRNFCKTRGITFYAETLSSDIPHTETAAREARYDFFMKCAKKFDAKAILTAHNLDDLAETIIYRIIKGTGISGLNGISEHRDIYYRPLLSVSRDKIELYCKKNKLNAISDSSNQDIKYKRNFIRHKILPLIKEINGNYTSALKNLATSAEETNELLEEYTSDKLSKLGNSTQKFLELSAPAQNYLIHKMFTENNLDYDRKKIEAVVAFIKKNANSKSGKKHSITTDLWIYTNSKKFELIKSEKPSNKEISINKEGQYQFDDYVFEIEKFNGTTFDFPKDNELKALVSLNEINFTLRHRKDGDTISPLGINGTQKLKKYLNEKKIPQHEKDSLILLCKNSEVLWVGGLGLSNKIRVINAPTHIIKLTKKEGYYEN